MGLLNLFAFLRCDRRTNHLTEADCHPLPDELDALKEIIRARAADPQTMQKLVICDFVEEFDGTALLTARGIEAAASFVHRCGERRQ